MNIERDLAGGRGAMYLVLVRRVLGEGAASSSRRNRLGTWILEQCKRLCRMARQMLGAAVAARRGGRRRLLLASSNKGY